MNQKTTEEIIRAGELRAAKRVWNKADVAAEYTVSKRTITQWLAEGRLTGTFDKINCRVIRFNPERVRAVLMPIATKAVAS